MRESPGRQNRRLPAKPFSCQRLPGESIPKNLAYGLAIKHIRLRTYFQRGESPEVFMLATAKVFTTGNSQAVRLPMAFRVDASEVWISKNEMTGEITLKPKASEDQRKHHLKELFRLIDENPFTEDFIPEREIKESRSPFSERAEPATAKRRKLEALSRPSSAGLNCGTARA